MRIPTEKHHVIATLLERYLRDPQRGMADVAAKQQAIPLYGSWTGTTFLRTDGEFFTLDQEEHPGQFLPEPDESWQIATLATACRQDSALAPLLPERPSDATNCEFCGGTGVVVFGGQKRDITCGECSGLGWLHPSLAQRGQIRAERHSGG
jgi:hypothetical protein